MEIHEAVILADISQKITEYLAGNTRNYHAILKNRCYQALDEIKVILQDEKSNDFDCVEDILGVFERLGVPIDERHDF